MSAHKRLKAHHKAHKAKGGKVQEYNAQGSEEMKEAHETKGSFKHGGHAKKKHGGQAEGHAPKHRLDKAKRGGKISEHHMKHKASGGSAMSSAAHRTPYENAGAGEGHQGIGKEMDKQKKGGHVKK